MSLVGPIIAASANLSLNYAERLLAGMTADQFARHARTGGVEIKSNHPAWVYGHLAIYPQRVMTALGAPAAAAALPANYEALFKNGVECLDDPTGKIYPPMAEITAKYFEATRAAIAAAASAPDATYAQANPAEGRMRELFPTIGAAVNFYLSGHSQVHLGQISAWRRAMGMSAA